PDARRGVPAHAFPVALVTGCSDPDHHLDRTVEPLMSVHPPKARNSTMPSSGKVLFFAAMGGALLQACAATPNVAADEKIAVAKASVQRAEQAGAPQEAPAELSVARDKLAQAQKANDDHKGLPAAALAEQADIDAQVAEATARANHSHK